MPRHCCGLRCGPGDRRAPMITRDRNRAGRQVAMNDGAMSRPGRLPPGWRQALAVVAPR